MSVGNMRLYQQSGGEWWLEYTNERGNTCTVVAAHRMDLVAGEIERLKAELHSAGDGDTWREACKRLKVECLIRKYSEDTLKAEIERLLAHIRVTTPDGCTEN